MGSRAWRSAALLPALLSAASAAEPASGPARAGQALALYRSAKQLFDAGEYRAAIASFEASQLRAPHRNNFYYIGEAHRRLGELRLAHHYYSRFAARAPAPRRAELRARLKRLRWSRPCVLEIETTPGGAAIRIDRASRGNTGGAGPLKLTLAGGSHRLVAALPGRPPVVRTLQAEFGERIKLHLSLAPGRGAQPAPAPRQGRAGAGPFLQAGLGLSLTRGRGLDGSAAPGLSGEGGYTLRQGRWGLSLLAGLDYAPGAARTHFVDLFAGLGAQLHLGRRIWLELLGCFGAALLLGADRDSAFFSGASAVDGPFSTFVFRPGLGLHFAVWRGLHLGLRCLLALAPRHPDYTAEVANVVRAQLQLVGGWRW